VAPAAVTEDSNLNLVYTFTRTGVTSHALTVNYTVAGTATQVDSDYTQTGAASFSATSGTITFAADSDTAVLKVIPTADITKEANETVTITLADGSGYSIGTTSAVSSTIRNDDIIGNNSNNTLIGTALNEYLFGAAGDDNLQGKAGNDRLDGGSGSDVLTGGPGNDTFLFRFSQSLVTGPDRITDFAIGADKIDLLTTRGGLLPRPSGFTRASNSGLTDLTPLVSGVFTDANGALAGNQALATNRAALVVATAPAIAGTYLVVNDSTTGFQASNDLVINLTGLTGTLPALGTIPVNAWFA
jgi:Ca2+-binding RTX toxin-like protein